MPEPRIPGPRGKLKSSLQIPGAIGPDFPVIIINGGALLPSVIFIDGGALHPSPDEAAKPSRRRPPRPRRSRPRSRKPTPYQAKRAAMEDLAIRQLRRDGFTPYFGPERRFLMTPPEFTLVLAIEPREVAQVIHEVLLQSVGYSDERGDGRREWVALSQRHFERRGIMSHSEAQRTLTYAVEQGYLLRRRRGRQQWEYAVHYRYVENGTG
jgi:hypothetical protein